MRENPISSLGANIYTYELTGDLAMRNILAHGIMRQKNPQTREDIFWFFTDFHEVMRVESPACTPARKFYQWRWSLRNRLLLSG